MEISNWDDLIISLERSLAAARRLRTYYESKQPIQQRPDRGPVQILPEGLSFRKMLIEIASKNGGKLIVVEAVTIIAANLHYDRDITRNNIYSTLYSNKKLFEKISNGVYQLIHEMRK